MEVSRLDIYKSRIEQTCVCRKCKQRFLSVDGSSCPYCVKPSKTAEEQTDEPKRKRKKKDESEEPPEDVKPEDDE